MTLEEIQKRITAIKSCAADSERAHAREDQLHEDFIEYVASLRERDGDLQAKAELVLSTRAIEFSRWCA